MRAFLAVGISRAVFCQKAAAMRNRLQAISMGWRGQAGSGKKFLPNGAFFIPVLEEFSELPVPFAGYGKLLRLCSPA